MLKLAKNDIQEYLNRKDGELLFNERDLQMHLAMHLINTRHYDDVDVEYYVPFEEKYTIAKADFTLPYSAAINKDNFYATQFHPEKSGSVGAKILKNFLEL